MIIRKRFVTLLEVLISMTLTLVIISTLSYFYQQVNYVNIELDRTQNASFERRYVESRLASVLPRAISSKVHPQAFHFFSSPDLGGVFQENSTSLVFTFDNCVKEWNRGDARKANGRRRRDRRWRHWAFSNQNVG